MKIVLFNGPPRAGKNTAATALGWRAHKHGLNMFQIGFSHHLKRFVHFIYLGDEGRNLPPDYFDDTKNEPKDFLGGRSWRQMYIHYSENVIKPLHGERWFANMLIQEARYLQREGGKLLIIPDSGFVPEAEAVADEFGAENMFLFRVHRAGRDFTGDSRGYINLAHRRVEAMDVENVDGDPDKMHELIWRRMRPWLEVDRAPFS